MGFREARELVAKSFFFREDDQLERPSLLHVAAIVVVEKIVDRPDAFVRPPAQERFKIRFPRVVGQFSSQNRRRSAPHSGAYFAANALAMKRPSLTPTSLVIRSFKSSFIRRTVARFASGSSARLRIYSGSFERSNSWTSLLLKISSSVRGVLNAVEL